MPVHMSIRAIAQAYARGDGVTLNLPSRTRKSECRSFAPRPRTWRATALRPLDVSLAFMNSAVSSASSTS